MSQTELMVSILNDYDPERGKAKEGGGNTNPTQVSKARREKIEISGQIIDLI